MKKIITGIIAVLIVIAGCAAPQEKKMTEQAWPFSRPVLFTPENFFSADPAIRENTLNDYGLLEEDSKKQVLTYLAYMLVDEKDAAARHGILDRIRELKAGPFIVAPLIRAYGAVEHEAVRTEISQFIKEYKPASLELAGLTALLKENDWDTKIKAVRVIASMKSKAGPAFPEILGVMRETGPSYGLYAECFDNAQQINAAAALSAAALDLLAPSHDLRESSLRKIYEVYTEEAAPAPLKQEALAAMVRTMYGGDEQLSALSMKMLQESGLQEAKARTDEYDAYKNMKVISMKELAAVKIGQKFSEQEDNEYLTLKLYYLKNNRPDAVKSIFDPVKNRQKQ